MRTSTFDLTQLLTILPQILLVVLALAVMVFDMATPKAKKRSVGIFTAVGLVIVLLFTLFWPLSNQAAFGGMFRDDGVARAFQVIFMLSGFLVILLSLDFQPLPHDGAYYTMLLFSILGMSLMAAAENIVLLYVGMEMTSISAYVLVGYLHDTVPSSEAGVKYFIFGAMTSAVMLYGMSLIYGLAGGVAYDEVAMVLRNTPLAVIAFLMVLVGFGFKVAMVPMHFWSPDVYQGAPTPITAFVSVASKAAGFAVLVRALGALFPGLINQWIPLIMAISMVTMTLGNMLAIPQRNIKRMLAYSSIAQAGYVLIGVTAGGVNGITAVIFYLLVYVVTNVSAFAVVNIVSNHVGSEDIEEYSALSRRSPFLGLALMVALLSLAGVPPAGGFVGKLFLFSAGIGEGLIGLVVIAVLNVIVGLYYYLNIVKQAYMVRSEREDEAIPVPSATRIALGLSIAAILLLGIFAAPCYNLLANLVATWF